jgi:polyphosphate kinase 2 (PPK2 family)
MKKMKRKEYERQMRVLHGELVAMQEWVKASGAKICIVFEDRDTESYRRWYDYSRARDAMFAATDTDWAPWYLAHSDDKRRARLNIIHHLLSQVPYKPLPSHDVTLPKRQRAGGYVEPDLGSRYIPAPF